MRALPMSLPARPLAAVLALLVMMPGMALGADATRDEVEAYAKEIAERQDALADTLVLMGRVIEITLVNPPAVGTDRFWSAVEQVHAFIDDRANGEALDDIMARLRGDDLRRLHGMFLGSIESLETAAGMMETTNYGFSAQASEVWNEARVSFLSFADGLTALKARHGLAP